MKSADQRVGKKRGSGSKTGTRLMVNGVVCPLDKTFLFSWPSFLRSETDHKSGSGSRGITDWRGSDRCLYWYSPLFRIRKRPQKRVQIQGQCRLEGSGSDWLVFHVFNGILPLFMSNNKWIDLTCNIDSSFCMSQICKRPQKRVQIQRHCTSKGMFHVCIG